MPRLVPFLLGACLLLASGCANRPKITTDFVAGTDFSRYHTFGLMSRLGDPGPLGGPTVLAGIRAAVDETLTARGYVATRADEADLLVMVHGRINPRVTVHEYGYDMPSHPWRRGYFSTWEERVIGRDTITVNVGRLTVDVIDRRTQELIWRGVARKEGVPDEPDAARLRIVVGRILERFPRAP